LVPKRRAGEAADDIAAVEGKPEILPHDRLSPEKPRDRRIFFAEYLPIRRLDPPLARKLGQRRQPAFLQLQDFPASAVRRAVLAIPVVVDDAFQHGVEKCLAFGHEGTELGQQALLFFHKVFGPCAPIDLLTQHSGSISPGSKRRAKQAGLMQGNKSDTEKE